MTGVDEQRTRNFPRGEYGRSRIGQLKISLPEIARRITMHRVFKYGITAIILLNGAAIGLETSKMLATEFGVWFTVMHQIVLIIFVFEAVVKIMAEYPKMQNYFKDGWNIFDFIVVVFCLIPATGQLAMVARVLRVMRILSVIPDLRVLVAVLVRSLPSMFNIVLLTLLIFYVYGILGHHLFADIDPTHWRTLGISLLSLFRVVTLEDWTDIMYAALEHYCLAWAFFVSLALIGTFVVFNLIIAVVIQNHDDATKEKLRDIHEVPSQKELMAEPRNARDALERLEKRLDVGP